MAGRIRLFFFVKFSCMGTFNYISAYLTGRSALLLLRGFECLCLLTGPRLSAQFSKSETFPSLCSFMALRLSYPLESSCCPDIMLSL